MTVKRYPLNREAKGRQIYLRKIEIDEKLNRKVSWSLNIQETTELSADFQGLTSLSGSALTNILIEQPEVSLSTQGIKKCREVGASRIY